MNGFPSEWWGAADAVGFKPSRASFVFGPPERDDLPDGQLVGIQDIRPPCRSLGTVGLDRDRSIRILRAFAQGDALPPLVAYQVPDPPFRYRLGTGFHRFHLSVAAGFAQIPLSILDHWEPWMTGDPMP